MAITISETPLSRSRATDSQLRLELEFIVRGTANDDEVQQIVEQTAGLDRQVSGITMLRKAILFDAEWVDEENDDGKWNATVIYDTLPLIAAQQQSFSFNIGAGTQHITQSIKQRSIWAPKKRKAPDYGGVIGVNDEGGPKGTDIIVPTFTFSETRNKTSDKITIGYVNRLAKVVGKINRSIFKGFRQAELLFLGADGTRLGNELWDVTYRFGVSLTRRNFNIGGTLIEGTGSRPDRIVGGITVGFKLGWDYMWVRYEKVVVKKALGSTEKTLKDVPIGVYTEQVYEETEFSLLAMDD